MKSEKRIEKLVADLKKVEYGWEPVIEGFDEDEFPIYGEDEWRPCYVGEVHNPEYADTFLRRAQGNLYAEMRKVGLPLWGWAQFDSFVAVFNGNNLNAAYKAAQSHTPCYWRH